MKPPITSVMGGFIIIYEDSYLIMGMFSSFMRILDAIDIHISVHDGVDCECGYRLDS